MYKNVLIATDGSELADKAVSNGLSFANELNASVKVVTVTEALSVSEIVAKAESGITDFLEKYNKQTADSAQRILSGVESTAKKMGLTCETIHVPDQHPAEGIIAASKDKACDLIILASHGRRGVKKVLLGSVANEVITHSTVPVLIYR